MAKVFKKWGYQRISVNVTFSSLFLIGHRSDHCLAKDSKYMVAKSWKLKFYQDVELVVAVKDLDSLFQLSTLSTACFNCQSCRQFVLAVKANQQLATKNVENCDVSVPPLVRCDLSLPFLFLGDCQHCIVNHLGYKFELPNFSFFQSVSEVLIRMGEKSCF